MEVTCLLLGKESVMNIIRECEVTHEHLQVLEEDRNSTQAQHNDEKTQFMQMLEKFGEEIKKVEDLERREDQSMMGLHWESISAAAVLELPDQTLIQPCDVTVQPPPTTYTTEAYLTLKKLMKTPGLPPFSGADPVPKDEGSWEQWEFQVKGFLDTHTQEAEHAVIIQSVRGAARELVGFVAYQADLNVILKSILKRFGKKLTGDKLQQDICR